MAIIALTNFIEITDTADAVQGRYQNSQPGELITLNGNDFKYLSFIYQGAAKNRTGDNLEAGLIMSSNWLSTGMAKQAVDGNWRVRVDTCVMNPSTFVVSRTLTTEFWVCASLGYDATTVDVVLSSAIDAVGSTAPTRVLQATQVGALPITGSISNI